MHSLCFPWPSSPIPRLQNPCIARQQGHWCTDVIRIDVAGHVGFAHTCHHAKTQTNHQHKRPLSQHTRSIPLSPVCIYCCAGTVDRRRGVHPWEASRSIPHAAAMGAALLAKSGITMVVSLESAAVCIALHSFYRTAVQDCARPYPKLAMTILSHTG